MKTSGKHAKIIINPADKRVFKTYNDPMYVDNEFFALSFLAGQNIMDLNPRKETLYTISMDFIEDARNPDDSDLKPLPAMLARYLKTLHSCSYKKFGEYITHEDIFADNILICGKFGTLYFIDWGLSQKRSTPYPDIASCALGVFNNEPESYRQFLQNYFEDISKIDFSLIEKYISSLYNKFKSIRIENDFETNSLDKRLENAGKVIRSVQTRGRI